MIINQIHPVNNNMSKMANYNSILFDEQSQENAKIKVIGVMVETPSIT